MNKYIVILACCMLLPHKTTKSIEEPTVIFFGTTLVILGGVAEYFYWNTDNHTIESLPHTTPPNRLPIYNPLSARITTNSSRTTTIHRKKQHNTRRCISY